MPGLLTLLVLLALAPSAHAARLTVELTAVGDVSRAQVQVLDAAGARARSRSVQVPVAPQGGAAFAVRGLSLRRTVRLSFAGLGAGSYTVRVSSPTAPARDAQITLDGTGELLAMTLAAR